MSPAPPTSQNAAWRGGVRRIGIFGGSFNPVHRGHLALASYAVSELNLDKVFFVPAHQNPLKKMEVRHAALLPSSLRMSLLRKAIRGTPKFSVSDIELKRKGISYTVDTLRFFNRKFGKKTQLFFLAGADQLKNFSRWKSPEEVLKLCRFVVATRPGSRLSTGDKRILRMPMPPIDISSSDIRKKLNSPRPLFK